MSSTLRLAAATFAVAVVVGCSSTEPQADDDSSGGKADGVCTGGLTLALEPAFGSFTANHPVAMVQEPHSMRWYVVEKSGVIQTMTGTGSSPTVFVDIRDRVNSTPNEAGLLGLAFHPNFATNHQVFLSYTTGSPLVSKISRFTSSDGGVTLDKTSEVVLLSVNQPFDNDKGGNIAFGPDGFLYIGFGDGGSSGDPNANGQNKNVLLGKMLRIDVNGPAPYGIPSDNPFATSGGAKEIFALGLRNPARWSFDSQTGQLWAGDWGQDHFEEIDVITKGANYGWRFREGKHCFNPSSNCPTAGMTDPVFEYDHDAGSSVTGGFVYRGTAFPKLQGKYVFADFDSGAIMAIPTSGSGDAIKIQTQRKISAFGQGADGELFALDFATGKILHVTGTACDSGFTPVYAIIKAKCKTCHIDQSKGGLSMKTKSIAYDNLVDEPSTSTGPCKNRTRVTPGTSNTSLIWQKVTHTNLCGTKMPPTGSGLTTSEVKTLEDWINGGAQQ
jgi:glucose/arabinose dehydrogenase